MLAERLDEGWWLLEGLHVLVKRIGEGTFALGVGGAAEGSVGVRGSLSVLVRSTVGLMVGVVLVSGVLLLSFVVPGLVIISAAVEAIVVMSESRGGSGMGCALWWLSGTGLAVMWSGKCWAIHKQAQSSLMVWN